MVPLIGDIDLGPRRQLFARSELLAPSSEVSYTLWGIPASWPRVRFHLHPCANTGSREFVRALLPSNTMREEDIKGRALSFCGFKPYQALALIDN